MAFYKRLMVGQKDVITYHGDRPYSESCNLIGRFDFSGNLITGWAQDLADPEDCRLRVFVVRKNEIVASVSVNGRDEVGWHFEILLDGSVSPQDVLYERIRVVVHDRDGNQLPLRLEGATQLALITEFIGNSTPPSYLTIDFHEGGNNDGYLGEGWSGQERSHRWAIGMQSVLTLPLPPPEYDSVLEILLWPFTAGPRLTAQALRILVNEIELASLSIERQSFLKVDVPRSVFLDAAPTVVRFLHPNAQSPAILGISKDTRTLAFAFKRFAIRRNDVAALASFGSTGIERKYPLDLWTCT